MRVWNNRVMKLDLGVPSSSLALAFSATLLAFAACTSAGSVATVDAGSAPTDAAPLVDAPVSASVATQTGRLVTAQTTTPIPSAKVTIGEQTVTTDADGRYSIVVPRGKPVTMRVSAEDHFSFVDQEWIMDVAKLDRGETSVLSRQTATLLAGFLTGYDKSLGVLGVRIVPLPGCTSEEGATLTLEPPGASLRYSVGGIPSAQATSAAKGQTITAIFYNVAVNVPLKVKVAHPSCGAVDFPIEQFDVRYTGNQIAEPGDSLSFFRAYLGPSNDAGSSDASLTDAGGD